MSGNGVVQLPLEPDDDPWAGSPGPPFHAGMELGRARPTLRDLVYPVDPEGGLRVPGEGTACPCCTQHVQVYRWSLYSTAARALILYWRLGRAKPDRWVHSNELKRHGHVGQGDAARLRLWGLVVGSGERREDGGKSGWWRATDLGERFVLRRATIPRRIYVFDGRRLRYVDQDDRITIDDALGKRFRYDEMMAGAMERA